VILLRLAIVLSILNSFHISIFWYLLW